MKKRLYRIGIFLFLVAVIPSCELLEDCKSCTMVTDDHGNITRGSELTYCGDKLVEIEGEEPVTIDGVTKYWDCK